MSNSNKSALGYVFYALILAGLVFGAVRTINFVQMTMSADLQWLGYVFVAFTGPGAVVWLFTRQNLAHGNQRAIALLASLFDLLGELALVYADTLVNSAANGQLTLAPDEMRLFVLASVGIVGANLVFAWLYHITDPDAIRTAAEEDMLDDVHKAAMADLNSPARKSQMARDFAPVLADSYVASLQSRVYQMAGAHVPPLQITGTVRDVQPAAPVQHAPAQKSLLQKLASTVTGSDDQKDVYFQMFLYQHAGGGMAVPGGPIWVSSAVYGHGLDEQMYAHYGVMKNQRFQAKSGVEYFALAWKTNAPFNQAPEVGSIAELGRLPDVNTLTPREEVVRYQADTPAVTHNEPNEIEGAGASPNG